MHIFRNAESPLGAADPASFVGAARTKRLAADDTGAAVHLYRVEFGVGARTNWHIHSGPQWLFVVDGRVRVQLWGERPHDVEAGDAVVILPGEKHWHGAVPLGKGSHLAINVNAQTEWLEPVTDEQYASDDGS